MNIKSEDIRAIRLFAPNFRNEAKRDVYRVLALLNRFKEASDHCGIPVFLLCAISSRESGVGKGLDVMGYGDNGHAFGIMQIDERYHSLQNSKAFSSEHIFQGGQILMQYIDAVSKKYLWPKQWCIRGGVAAYNFGMKNVRTQDNLDVGTSGNNYSEDVIVRAQYYYDSI